MDTPHDRPQDRPQAGPQDKWNDEIESSDIPALDPRIGLAAAVVIAAVVVGIGFVILRRHRHQSLISRLQDALPEVDDLRASLRRLQDALPEVDDLRASLKRPLERAVKAL